MFSNYSPDRHFHCKSWVHLVQVLFHMEISDLSAFAPFQTLGSHSRGTHTTKTIHVFSRHQHHCFHITRSRQNVKTLACRKGARRQGNATGVPIQLSCLPHSRPELNPHSQSSSSQRQHLENTVSCKVRIRITVPFLKWCQSVPSPPLPLCTWKRNNYKASHSLLAHKNQRSRKVCSIQ